MTINIYDFFSVCTLFSIIERNGKYKDCLDLEIGDRANSQAIPRLPRAVEEARARILCGEKRKHIKGEAGKVNQGYNAERNTSHPAWELIFQTIVTDRSNLHLSKTRQGVGCQFQRITPRHFPSLFSFSFTFYLISILLYGSIIFKQESTNSKYLSFYWTCHLIS